MANAALRGPFGRIPLGSTHLNIGYSTDNTLVVNETPLPSLFATINPNGLNYTINAVRDGVWVNGQPLRLSLPRQLQSNDTIQVQQTTLTYEDDQPASYTPIPPSGSDMNPYGDNAYNARAAGTPALYSNANAPTQDVTPRENMPARPFVLPGSPTPVPGANPAYNSSSDWQQQGANRDPYQTPLAPPAPPPFVPSQSQSPVTPPPPAGQQVSTPPQRPQARSGSRGLRTLLYALTALLILLGIGSAIGFYQLTRPQPVTTVSSQYSSGTTPVGSVGTSFHVLGYKFSDNSPITFLLDNNPIPQQLSVRSDDQGNFKADLPVTPVWSVGPHKLTARDGGSYLAKNVSDLTIVNPGDANTPGPNGAPSDATGFGLQVKVTTTGNSPRTLALFVLVSRSGTVCDPETDTNQPLTTNGKLQDNTPYKKTSSYTCRGSYKAGKISYTETSNNTKDDFSDGTTCQANSPFTFVQLDGTFTNGTTANGNFSSPAYTLNCNKGGGTVNGSAETGTWTATIV